MFKDVLFQQQHIRGKPWQLRSLDEAPSLAALGSAIRTSGAPWPEFMLSHRRLRVKCKGEKKPKQKYDRWASSAAGRGKLEAEARQSSFADGGYRNLFGNYTLQRFARRALKVNQPIKVDLKEVAEKTPDLPAVI